MSNSDIGNTVYRDQVKLSYQTVLHELVYYCTKLKQQQYIQFRNQERIYNQLLRTKYDNYYNYLLSDLYSINSSEKNYIITKTNVLIALTKWIKNDDFIEQTSKVKNHTNLSRLPTAIIFHILSYNISEGCFPNEHELPTTDFLIQKNNQLHSIPIGPSIYGIPYGVWKMYIKCRNCMEMKSHLCKNSDNCVFETFDIPIYVISDEYDFLMNYGNKKHKQKTEKWTLIVEHMCLNITHDVLRPLTIIDPITFTITENRPKCRQDCLQCLEKGMKVLECFIYEDNTLYTNTFYTSNTLKNPTNVLTYKTFAFNVNDTNTMDSLAFAKFSSVTFESRFIS